MAKGQRGRPVVFKGAEKRHILSVIRKHGLTKGREVLAGEKVSISLPTMGKFAAEAGIELSRGRPAGVAAKPAKPAKAKKAAKKAKKAKKPAAAVEAPAVEAPVAVETEVVVAAEAPKVVADDAPVAEAL